MSLLLKRVKHLLGIYKPFIYFSVNNPTDSRLKKKKLFKIKEHLPVEKAQPLHGSE